MHARLCSFFLALAALTSGGCLHVKMDPIQVNAVVDVNVKVDREVQNLLSDIYGDSSTINVPTSPAR
ncbi:MAG: hypothetical protein Q7S40_03310 [Opitutaceae bacterium]|nr:hypothetical protein [Opitutaceae bacterium]